jgi:hypothetical protein
LKQDALDFALPISWLLRLDVDMELSTPARLYQDHNEEVSVIHFVAYTGLKVFRNLNPYWVHSPKLASFKTGYPLGAFDTP